MAANILLGNAGWRVPRCTASLCYSRTEHVYVLYSYFLGLQVHGWQDGPQQPHANRGIPLFAVCCTRMRLRGLMHESI